MAYIFYFTVWESEFDNIVFKKDKVQDMNISQIKLEVQDTFRRGEKITTKFEPSDDSDGTNFDYLDAEVIKLDVQLSLLEEDYNGFTSHYSKQSAEGFLIQRPVRTTMTKLYDKGLFDGFPNAEAFLGDFLFFTRRRPDLEELKDVVVQKFYSET